MMSEFKEKYQKWLSEFAAMLEASRQQPLGQLLNFADTIKAYLKAGKELTVYETQLFIETFKRQATEAEQLPSLWPETLWYELAQITDKTQIEWQELLQDLEHKGTYQQGEQVGMGLYLCQQCLQQQSFYHPAALGACVYCGGRHFSRHGLPV
jgi:hypothetical protein